MIQIVESEGIAEEEEDSNCEVLSSLIGQANMLQLGTAGAGESMLTTKQIQVYNHR